MSDESDEIQKLRILNERLRIYGSIVLATILVVSAVVVALGGERELAGALLASTAVPTLIGATAHRKH